MKKGCTLILLYLLFQIGAKAQNYAQYLSTKTDFNPAMAGIDSTLNISGGSILQVYNPFRNNNFNYNYNFYRFSADQYVHFLRGGIGLDLKKVDYGIADFNSINLSYAPHFELFKHKLSIQPGFKIGYNEQTIQPGYSFFSTDGNEIISGGGVDGSTPWSGTKHSFLDYQAGLFMYTKHFFAGASLKHLTEPSFTDQNVEFSLPHSFTGNIGANLNFKKDTLKRFTFSPTVAVIGDERNMAIISGLSFKINAFVVGAKYVSYSNNLPYYNIIFNAGIQFKHIKITHGFNFKQAPYILGGGNSQEIHITGYIPYKKKSNSKNSIRFN